MFLVKAVTLTTPATFRQVDFWLRQGIIHADREAEGSGTPRVLLGPAYEKARAVAWLVNAGLGPWEAATLFTMGKIKSGPFTIQMKTSPRRS